MVGGGCVCVWGGVLDHFTFFLVNVHMCNESAEKARKL